MTFAALLSEATASHELPGTGDVLAVGLPLLRQLAALHADGRVSRLDGVAHFTYIGGELLVEAGATQAPRRNEVVGRRNPERPERGVEIRQRIAIDHGDGTQPGQAVTSLDVNDGSTVPDRPVFVVGYRAWEQLLDHHDALTDVHLAGLALVSYATGLDLDRPGDLHRLALGRRHLIGLAPALHPVVAGVLTDMIDPDRHRRPGELNAVIAQLEHHRELPTDLDLSDAYQTPGDWRPAVLDALRERVFDVSRRNRALYFKPSASAVSLTDVSVPLLLDIERVRPGDLLTWNDDVAAEFTAGKPVDLERWCRFEETPYLSSAFDSIITAERRLRAEHGQGRLRLIIAFLRWVDPETGESITSPLLSMAAELTVQRGVRNRYRVVCDPDAEVNPVLRHVFDQRFDIGLPTHLEPTPAAVADFTQALEAQVRATDPSIRIELVTTPRISLIRRRAQLRVDNYVRRRASALASSGRWRRQPHSYDPADWRPLGRELFRAYVQPTELPLRLLAGDEPTRSRPPDEPSYVAPIRERNEYAVEQSSDRHRWEVDLCAVTLAALGSRRTNLARDYDTAISVFDAVDPVPMGALASFETIFAPHPRAVDQPPIDGIEVQQPLVLAADDSQARAVRRAIAEESFIIQGPPGTGKSQTIANLIAALVAENKRVLFVCEKRAAIDVVAHRLSQAGLGELVATIHDSQLDRKSFIASLGATYESWLSDAPDMREQRRDDALAAVRELLDPLEAEYADFTDSRGGRVSIANLIERLVAHRAAGVVPPSDVTAGADGGVDAAEWLQARPALDRVIAAKPPTEAALPLGAIASLRVRPGALVGQDPVVAARAVGAALTAAVQQFAAAGQATTGAPGSFDQLTIGQLSEVSADLPRIASVVEYAGHDVLDPSSESHAELRRTVSTMASANALAAERAGVASRWSAPLGAPDARAALLIAHDKEGSLFKAFSGRWREVKGLVERSYRFGDHQVRPTIVSVLAELVAMHDANEQVAAARLAAAQRFGSSDLADVATVLDRLHDHPLLLALRGISSMSVSAATRPGALPTLATSCANLLAAAGTVMVSSAVTVGALGQLGAALNATPVSHERMLLAWMGLRDTPAVVTDAALHPTASTDQVELAVLTDALARSGITNGGAFAGQRLDDLADRLLERHRELLAANAGMVATRARARFRDHVAFADSSMAGRSDRDKEFKRAFNAGRRVLEREFQKKMRHRAIRELASGETGLVVSDLKPVWMMSPLSVSDTLPLELLGSPAAGAGEGWAFPVKFDVVVFDEASQIPVEDAVPTLLRSAQAIVVGDRMQLPPTRFFAGAHDLDDEVVVDVDGHPQTVALDADSFLAQADLALPSSLLSWHYRSRSEVLISYSNHAFYGARLATVPDRALPGDERAEIVVTSEFDAAHHVHQVFDRPISFHRVVNGVYRERRNETEAAYIAELVRALIRHPDRRTIGVVAFSEAQQAEIETALAELGTVDPEFAAQLEAEEQRVDDEEFVGLFVKNLENVQGDERDVIVMSVCYAPDDSGRMRMNFGPINQSGGERRLNVIFSRAKRHMAIVSSIRGAAITNTHNDGAAHLARFLTFAEAESRQDGAGAVVTRALVVSATGVDAGNTRGGAIADQIADALRTLGHTVDIGVGRSEFTIDVAVRTAAVDGSVVSDGYALGVLVEPGTGDATATARLIAEAGVLAGAGWNITRVLATEWWFDPEAVVTRLDAALRDNATYRPA